VAVFVGIYYFLGVISGRRAFLTASDCEGAFGRPGIHNCNGCEASGSRDDDG